jgi:pyruvate, orthophosphate dikinase
MSVDSTSPSRRTAKQWVFGFDEGTAEMRGLLGGKGANLAEMTHVLGAARVPGGFTITTEACVEYMKTDGRFPDGLEEEIAEAVRRVERDTGQRFGGGGDPLLLSVRSGAPVSMPGMLDTVLNLGLNSESVEDLSEASGSPRFAWDSYRRLVQMYSDVVRGVPAESFEEALAQARDATGSAIDADLDQGALRALTERFLALFTEHTGVPFPNDPREQLRGAVEAVFSSWNNDRAIAYRRLEGIPDDLGTAVTVQRMVFGNRGSDSGSGVAFTRDPTTGAPEPSGDFLLNAQGEDVVSGVRNTRDLSELRNVMPEVYEDLIEIMRTLEHHYRDMQDVEFTIEQGRLYILQTRRARRPAQAAVRFAFDAVGEGLLGREEALATIDPGSLDALLHPTFDPERSYTALTRAVPASPGGAKGAIVFTAEEAERRADAGDDVILVRPFTSAEDVAGFHAAKGVLTSRGGKSSHAAIVARGMGRPCVCGASDLDIEPDGGVLRVGDRELHAGDAIAIDGSTGVVTADDVRLIEPKVGKDFAAVLSWADAIRRLGVRANADTAEDAAHARELGAEGIGLCRTEHMFFGADREELVRDMFVAGELWRRARDRSQAGSGDEGPDDTASAEEEFSRALDGLKEMQKADFIAIFGGMSGLPVTVRLLDPPIHEFISIADFEQALEEAERVGDPDMVDRTRLRLAVARELEETNPMLGTRGARLGLLLPALYEMQVAAILEAALAVAAKEEPPKVEIMVPLIAFESELDALTDLIHLKAKRVMHDAGGEVEYSVGTMIELPRACLRAGEIAAGADFFSFGTNDLTQTTIGLSRDDAEGSFLPSYLARRILVRSPFETLDVPGVGELVKIAVERGRATKPELKLGICGEHGGDPASIEFFDSAGLDYVSCSPYRVPVARVAAAQAAAGLTATQR